MPHHCYVDPLSCRHNACWSSDLSVPSAVCELLTQNEFLLFPLSKHAVSLGVWACLLTVILKLREHQNHPSGGIAKTQIASPSLSFSLHWSQVTVMFWIRELPLGKRGSGKATPPHTPEEA